MLSNIHSFKNYCIIKLGGYTKEQYSIPSLSTYRKGCNNGYKLGKQYIIYELDRVINNSYGVSKQEWIDNVYNKLNELKDAERY